VAHQSPRSVPTATIADVARAAGVSTATAARALGGYGSVSAGARERVTEAARRLGYQRNELAAAMITGRSNTVAFVVADIENSYFAAAARGVSDVARAAGYELLLVNTDEDVAVERSALAVLVSKRVDGVIVAPASPVDVAHLAAVQQTGCPVVLLDRRVQGVDADVVLVDNLAAARDVVERLLAAGHRRIAMVTGGASSADQERLGSPSGSTGRDRVDGYLGALADAGVPDPGEYLRTGAHSRALAEQRTRELLELPSPPTAVFASNSVVAIGVLKALRDARVEIPQQISLVSFDDADWTGVVAPAISVVAQPAQELGRCAAEVLVARMRGAAGAPRSYVRATEFVSRDSVAGPPADLRGRG
jgi:LacI family transcriptional regulator